MALDRQVSILSVDTGDLYSNNEKRLHWINHKLRAERKWLKGKKDLILKEIKTRYKLSDKEIKNISNLTLDKLPKDVNYPAELLDSIYECYKISDLISYKNKVIDSSKEKLLMLLNNKVNANIVSNGKDHIRKIRENEITDRYKINVFDSSLIRTLGIKANEFTTDFLVIQVYYFDVFKDIMYYGFEYLGEKYIYFTSSAGQIRTKKAVFIKESVWKKHEKTIMCGLTIDKINEKGGNNPNKHLAYMALSNSATDVWEDFDIDKTIVINDFETSVFGVYDLISDTDYSITRTVGKIPIPHADGAGMVLHGKNRMVRLPFVKGLLGVFDFVKFIKDNNCSPIIKDIYGVEHDVIAEGIEVIFTKSQFKMHKYYDSYEQYKEYFKKYNCTAGYTNIEEDKIRNATINYQMLQTFTDFTDEELYAVAKKSIDKLDKLGTSVESMMDILGVNDDNIHKTYMQKSIEIYPNIMNDKYIKDIIKSVKDSLIHKYRSGKLMVNGKYTFILPDFYASCQYWFMGIEEPEGLLADGEVYCALYENSEKLDCLRSPHLFKEHAVRNNIACKIYGDRKAKCDEWFTTNALYTSTHDLISKLLQFDVDGDKSLVISDKAIISLAEKNMNDIVPLYYNMKVAKPRILNNESIYEGLVSAFTGGNIGYYSNSISKIWNSDVFISGTDEEKKEAINVVKYLCCENNFSIDFAKTLYMPTRPEYIDNIIKEYTKKKLPHFFYYSKDKFDEQISVKNGSFVNKLEDIIVDRRLNYCSSGLGELNYKVLMHNPNTTVKIVKNKRGRIIKEGTNEMIYEYENICRDNYFSSNVLTKVERAYDVLDADGFQNAEVRSNFLYDEMITKIKADLSTFGYSDVEICDMLIYHLYNKKESGKAVLWLCYGDIIYNNIKHNLKYMSANELGGNHMKVEKERICKDCGKPFMTTRKITRCPNCERAIERERKRIQRANKKAENIV